MKLCTSAQRKLRFAGRREDERGRKRENTSVRAVAAAAVREVFNKTRLVRSQQDGEEEDEEEEER